MRDTDIHKVSEKTWKVLKTEPENHDITSLYLIGHDERLRKRQAGQWASIRVLQEDGWSAPHPFTISCAPEDEVLQFTIKKAEEFTSSIPALKPGTPVKVEGPFGVFCRDIEKRREIAMIAGGVGITPFLSVLRWFRNIRAKSRMTIFWTNKTIQDVFAADELKQTTKELDLTVIHTISREKEVEVHAQAEYPCIMYVSGYTTRELLQKYLNLPDISCYVCGPPRMQESMLEELGVCGVDPKSVEKENFSYQGAR